ncbi:MAG: 2-C-methyl-D-erythritol 4-phosphate cytidylyltransferase [Planctomycetes bacterium]|nr:2-C-methyl-D-erythritol 4-phosphate cytidylyltransferase [Planctomycetota bacterium]
MSAIPSSTLIVVAAGNSQRMGGATPKQFMELDGRSLLLRSLDAFADIPWITERIVVLPQATLDALATGKRPNTDRIELTSIQSPSPMVAEMRRLGVSILCAGGARRQDSVYAGMCAVQNSSTLVLIHDAARPFATRMLIERVAIKAAESGAAIPGIMPRDTIKTVDAQGRVTRTIERKDLRCIQTPQAFTFSDLLAAHRRYRHVDVTDDAAMYELAARPVPVVEGDEENIKITGWADIPHAQAILRVREGGSHEQA